MPGAGGGFWNEVAHEDGCGGSVAYSVSWLSLGSKALPGYLRASGVEREAGNNMRYR